MPRDGGNPLVFFRQRCQAAEPDVRAIGNTKMDRIMDMFDNNKIFTHHVIDNKINIIEYVKSVLDLYCEELRSIKADYTDEIGINDALLIIDELINCIINSITIYFDGKPSGAFQTFSKTMNKIWPQIKIFHKTEMKMFKLYRCRVWPYNKNPLQEDIFHIPFEKRHLVENQRYSINGYPCLYLSTSLLCCIHEINRQENTSFIASRYLLMNKWPKSLDLTIDYIKIKNSTLHDQNLADFFISMIRQGFIAKLIMFPLIFAVSIKNIENNKFNSEYIIPHLLLEWIRQNQEIDCIKYNSYDNVGNVKNTDLLTNFVFPLMDSEARGYCQSVLDIFSISFPKMMKMKYIPNNIDNYLNDYYKSDIGLIENEL